MKSLKEISWGVTEEVYRNDSSLHYSAISKYARDGFASLNYLEKHEDTSYFAFGRAVDCLITGSEEEFHNNFIVIEESKTPSIALLNIAKRVASLCNQENLSDVPDELLINPIEESGWNSRWSIETRIKKFREECSEYYQVLIQVKTKTPIGSSVYSRALSTANALKSSKSTKFYFEANSPFDNNIERFYQLKFKDKLNGVPYKCMVDELIVIHDRKVIVPIDLKTTSDQEYNFFRRFVSYHYDLQARLYWKMIRNAMDKDPYFRDFKLANFQFVVINSRNLNPLVWEFEHTAERGKITLGTVEMEDPLELGSLIHRYLEFRVTVPDGIEMHKPNKLEDWIK